MSWQVGDLAVCVDASDYAGTAPTSCRFVKEGAVYTVLGIVPPQRWSNGAVQLGLILAETSNPTAPNGDFNETRFRKIEPDKHESCEPEFVTLIKRSKQPEFVGTGGNL